MSAVLLVGCGGFLGAVLRYLISLLGQKLPGSFPAATLIVNIIGCFVIGLCTGLFSSVFPDKKLWKLFFTTGFCGGFTTFSTFSLETLDLIQNGHLVLGTANILLSVLLCLGGVLSGKALANLIALH